MIARTRSVYSVATSALAGALFVTALLAASPVRAADTYNVDPVHSTVIFSINHLGTSWVFGRFDDVSKTSTFTVDEKTPAFDFSVNVDSVDTNNKQRDTHLKSADFFSVKEFPTITFKSTSSTSKGEKMFDVTGDLTMHGVTKTVTVPLEFIGAADTKMGARAGYKGEFSIKRTDYGMDKMVGMVGDEVHITVSFEGVKG